MIPQLESGIRRAKNKIRNIARSVYRFCVQFMYNKSRYRLFLTQSFESMSDELALLASATGSFSSFVRPILISAPFGQSMLVMAPHQDDEVIGCGGAAALQALSGSSVTTIILQDGADEHNKLALSREQMTRLRNEESMQAASCLGLPPPIFLGYESLKASHDDAVAAIVNHIERKRVDAVFLPFALDAHPDHRATNKILADALEQVRNSIRIFGYEVWSLAVPSVIVEIDAVIDQKSESLRRFKIANSAVDYVNSSIGLAMYRTRFIPASNTKYAECFFECPSAEFVALVRNLEASKTY